MKQLSHFRLESKLGEGGMGEVFLATDERLGREVAIKILPAAVTDDPDRLARLEREARILASLNHPNIAGLHDIGEADGVHYLVMELAPGESLAARLARGPVTVDEALAIAIQIARALEAAHDSGIVHRDLKPANVMVDASGTVKLLDFGLAKAVEGDPSQSSPSLSHSPTMTRGTAAGMILGTASYMAPEQARGKTADKRADVWAFGVVLFEMLSGRRLFDGETVSDILAAVLRADIEWDTLPAGIPRELRTLLRRTIVRDPDQRLRDIADVRIVLDELASGEVADEQPPAVAAHPDTAAGTPRRLPIGWVAGAFAAGALIVWGALALLGGGGAAGPATPGDIPRLSFRQLTLLPGAESQGAIAPDGESFLFVQSNGGQSDILLQRVDGRNAINLTESCPEADYGPAFSPDGRRIAFRSECAGGGIFVMGALGESLRKVTDEGYAPTWSPDGSRVVVAAEHPSAPTARGTRSDLWAVDIESGERTLITERDAVGPAWSPDGRWIAFWGLPFGFTSFRDIYVVAADGSMNGEDEAIQLTDDNFVDWSPAWSADSRWIYFSSTRGGTFNIWRLPFDPDTGRSTGEPEPVTAPSSNVWHLSLSADGRRMIFTDRNIRQRSMMARFDTTTGTLATDTFEVPMGSMTMGSWGEPSPDGTTLLNATPGYPQHLVLVNADGSQLRMLTDGPYRDRQGAWSPDGQWIAFQTDRFPESRIGLIRADGSGLRPLGAPAQPAWYPRWSPDGRSMTFTSNDGAFRLEPWADDPASTIEPLPAPGDGLNFWAEGFSSDGRLIAGTIYRGAVPESVAIYSLEDETYQVLAAADGASGAQFIGDRHVVWTTRRRLLVHDLETGTSRTLVEVGAGRQFLGFSSPAVGDWLTWVEFADESDVWLASFD